jgi:predicted amidohydrolase
MIRQIRIAAVQMNASPSDLEIRLVRAELLISQAAAEGAQLIVLPELFNRGYEYSQRNYQFAEPLKGRTLQWMVQIANYYSVFLAGSFLRLDQEDIFDSLLLVSPDGIQWCYDKNYPWIWEHAYFKAGHKICVANTALGRIGLLVCWDACHPQMWARYAGKVDLMVVCSCPPRAHQLTFHFPNDYVIPFQNTGTFAKYLSNGAEHTFGECLRRQAAWLGVPVVNTTGTGLFVSTLPLPQLSWRILTLLRPQLWKKTPNQISGRYFNETYIADEKGNLLGSVPPEIEGSVVATLSLPPVIPRPGRRQPVYGISRLTYLFDWLAGLLYKRFYTKGIKCSSK